MNDKTLLRVSAIFLVISAVFIAVAIVAMRNINRSVATSDWVNHTHAVILEAQEILSAVHAAEGSLRAYALTGDARDQSASRTALDRTAEHLEVAKSLTRNETALRDQLLQLEEAIGRHADFLRGLIASRQAGNLEAVRIQLAADDGGQAIGDIERRIEKLKADEMADLAERDRASYLQAQTTRWTVWLCVVLGVLLLGATAWLVRDDIAARRKSAAALAAVNEQLESKVRERTVELATANEQLSKDILEREWANQALEHQLRYNQIIINSISDIVMVLTRALNISRVNPAVVNLTGHEPKDLINQPLSRIVRLVAGAGGAEAPMLDPIAQALREGRDLRDQPAVVEDRRGRQTMVSFSLFPLRDRDKVVGGVVTLRVLTPPPAQA